MPKKTRYQRNRANDELAASLSLPVEQVAVITRRMGCPDLQVLARAVALTTAPLRKKPRSSKS